MRIKRDLILQRKKKRKISLSRLLILLFAFAVLGLAILSFTLAWFLKDLPSPSKLKAQNFSSTMIFDRNGKLLFEFYKEKNQIPVKLDEISKYAILATISVEDKDFYKHKGISEKGILRAFFNTVFRRKLQGGSTITQQLIKNILLTPERTLTRKIKEVILAFEVERRYTKDEILEMYLNNAPYGGSFWGIESAARGYFGKRAKDLNLVEAAILAGLPQRPSYYSPFIGSKNAWKYRTKHVLRRMREDGYITRKEEKKALEELEKITFKKPKLTIRAPHFVFFVKEKLEKEYGENFMEKGLKITTTLDLDLQEEAEKIAYEEIKNLKKYNVTNAGIIALDSKTSEILAMVGSYDFFDEKYGKFNTTLALRQPGSAVKPITYAVAFEKGYTPATVIMDVPTIFPQGDGKEYKPVNYDGKYRGPIQLRFALGNSINVVAVKLLALIGIEDFLKTAYNMGITTLAPTKENLRRFGLSVTLGGGEVRLLEITNAYTVFARGGTKLPYSYVLEIKDYKGKTIYKKKKPREVRVFDKSIAFLISHILSDNNARLLAFGPNSYLRIPGKTVAVKTGTTNDKRDNWTIGFTKDITIGVWVGNNDNSPMDKRIASGITGASPIWHKLMRFALNTYDDGIIEKPDNVIAKEIDAFLGGLPKEGYPTRVEYFVKGTEPKSISPYYKKLKISKITGKLANEYEIKTGNYEEKEFIVITENDPISKDGKNRWQEAIDKWMSEQEDEKYHPPKEISDYKPQETQILLNSPKDNSKLETNTIEVKGKIVSDKKLKTLEIYINDSLISKLDNPDYDIDEILNLEDGVYTLKIIVVDENDKKIEKTVTFGVNVKPED